MGAWRVQSADGDPTSHPSVARADRPRAGPVPGHGRRHDHDDRHPRADPALQHLGDDGLVGDERLQPGAGGAVPAARAGGRPVRPQARVHARPGGVHRRLARLRPLPHHPLAHRLPLRAGRGRRGRHPRLAGDPHGSVPRAPAGVRLGPVRRRQLAGRRRRPGPRRLPHHARVAVDGDPPAPLVAADLLLQRPGRPAGYRPGPGAGAAARPRDQRRGDRRARRAAVVDRGSSA